MFSMIGGIMLLCAVAAMLLLATWSIARDEAPDSQPRDGFLAMRHFVRSRAKSEKPARPDARRRQARSQPKKPRRIQFDPDEMAEIEAEAEETMPAFLRDAREEY